MGDIPLCVCGCGLPTLIYKESRSEGRRVFGQPAPSRRGHSRIPLFDRLRARTDRTDPDGCWPWIAHRNKSGYGIFATQHQRPRFAHRLIWEQIHGPIPPGLLVCHTCDNPPCVRPNHLFLGTDADNARDKVAKGRGRNPAAKLNEADVREIRLRRAAGERGIDIAAEYGLHDSAVSMIVNRKRWPHV